MVLEHADIGVAGRIVFASCLGVRCRLNIGIANHAQSGLDARFEPLRIIGRQSDIAKTIAMSGHLAKAVIRKVLVGTIGRVRHFGPIAIGIVNIGFLYSCKIGLRWNRP